MLPHQLLSFTVGGTLRRAPPGPIPIFFEKSFVKSIDSTSFVWYNKYIK